MTTLTLYVPPIFRTVPYGNVHTLTALYREYHEICTLYPFDPTEHLLISLLETVNDLDTNAEVIELPDDSSLTGVSLRPLRRLMTTGRFMISFIPQMSTGHILGSVGWREGNKGKRSTTKSMLRSTGVVGSDTTITSYIAMLAELYRRGVYEPRTLFTIEAGERWRRALTLLEQFSAASYRDVAFLNVRYIHIQKTNVLGNDPRIADLVVPTRDRYLFESVCTPGL